MSYPSWAQLKRKRRLNMTKELLPYLLYTAGSALFLLGSLVSIGQKLRWW